MEWVLPNYLTKTQSGNIFPHFKSYDYLSKDNGCYSTSSSSIAFPYMGSMLITFSCRSYRIFSIKCPRHLIKILNFWPGVFSRPVFNRGPAFTNEMRFPAIFPGRFIITDPRKPRGSLSVLDDFSPDNSKLQYYGTYGTCTMLQSRFVSLTNSTWTIYEWSERCRTSVWYEYKVLSL